MIISVDTEKDSAVSLRKAAKIIQDIADSKEPSAVPTVADIKQKRTDLFTEQPKEEKKKPDFSGVQVY
jgi:hypothetical protein